MLAYLATMLVAVLLLSALTYLGPPFGPSYEQMRAAICNVVACPN